MSPKLSIIKYNRGVAEDPGVPMSPPHTHVNGIPLFSPLKSEKIDNPMPTLKFLNSLPLNNALPGRLMSKIFRENQL